MSDHAAMKAVADQPRPGRTTAFVFQGGGSSSAAQVGTLRALCEAGIVPDLVIGSSAGAINAVALATEPTPYGLRRLESLWLGLRLGRVVRASARELVGALVRRRDGLMSTEPIARVLQRGSIADRLEETVIPSHVVATDWATGEPIVISAGASVPALLASSAFPGIFPPVTLDGARLVDGGVSADTPVLQAEALGAEECYVLPAAVSDNDREPARGPLAIAYRALGLMLDSAARRDAATATGRVHALPAAVSSASHPLDFRETGRLIRDGYSLARRWLSEQSPEPRRLAPANALPAWRAPRSACHCGASNRR